MNDGAKALGGASARQEQPATGELLAMGSSQFSFINIVAFASVSGGSDHGC